MSIKDVFVAGFLNNPENSDYLKYRGKCKELSEELVKNDPTLILVKGWYYCPIWGEQPHWWCKDVNGKIYDPSVLQFPSNGLGEYVEFNGEYNCEYCDKTVKEENVYNNGHHVYCSYDCAYSDVM